MKRLPPIGMCGKVPEGVKIYNTCIVQNHLRDVLLAINAGFLAEMPPNESGTAKEVDVLDVEAIFR